MSESWVACSKYIQFTARHKCLQYYQGQRVSKWMIQTKYHRCLDYLDCESNNMYINIKLILHIQVGMIKFLMNGGVKKHHFIFGLKRM